MPEVPGRRVTKKDAARHQILIAVRMAREEEYESAITLANAAEGMLAGGEQNHFYEQLKAHRPEDVTDEKGWVNWLNETAHWLKHPTPQLGVERAIMEYETWIMVMRAISKYYWTFRENTKEMRDFVDWARAQGFLNPETEYGRGVEES
jgi:hypothetical protein